MKKLKVDFHVHTTASRDSSIKPEDLFKKSKKLGIIPSITDHNSISSIEKFRELTADFIPGEEIKTDVGDLIGLYIQDLIPKKTPFLEALDKIKEQGGLSCLPHGFDEWRYNLGIKYPKYAKKVDIIETFNARCLSSSYNKTAEEFAKKNNLLSAGGSDCHFLFEFGNVYTEVPEFDLTNPKKLLKALKKAKIFGKLAPKALKGTTTIYSKLRALKMYLLGPKD